MANPRIADLRVMLDSGIEPANGANAKHTSFDRCVKHCHRYLCYWTVIQNDLVRVAGKRLGETLPRALFSCLSLNLESNAPL